MALQAMELITFTATKKKGLTWLHKAYHFRMEERDDGITMTHNTNVQISSYHSDGLFVNSGSHRIYRFQSSSEKI